MKKQSILELFALLFIAGIIIVFSSSAKAGASDGLALAQSTIIPSLTPLLIIFLVIMKTAAKDVLAKLFGFISHYLFKLPYVSFPAIFFGLIGGYPTGALLTKELFDAKEIDTAQAKKIMSFNFCGGCGFIITAVGTATLKTTKAGVILFLSSVISSLIIGIAQSIPYKYSKEKFYSFTSSCTLLQSLNEATSSAVLSVLNITAYIMLFSAISSVIPMPKLVAPLIEITSGLCTGTQLPLPLMSAFLSFGGLCIHLQIIGILRAMGINYLDFLVSRIVSSVLSFFVAKLLLILFPIQQDVFANSGTASQFSSVNTALSILMILGCFVLILDLNSMKKSI